MKKSLLLIIVILVSTYMISCVDNLDSLESNIFFNEETDTLQDEYIFKVVSTELSEKYLLNDTEYDSENENGMFLTINLTVRRLTLEDGESLEIDSDWFKAKKGVGMTLAANERVITDNEHIASKESSIIPFELEQGEEVAFSIVIDLPDDFLETDRILVLEIDKPWSSEGAKEIVLAERPSE